VSQARIEQGLESLAQAALAAQSLSGQVAQAASRYVAVLRNGGTLYFCGNGGSAADAQHLAAEYVVRYVEGRRALAAIALATDTSILTAAGNDLGFDQVGHRAAFVEGCFTGRWNVDDFHRFCSSLAFLECRALIVGTNFGLVEITEEGVGGQLTLGALIVFAEEMVGHGGGDRRVLEDFIDH